jgi:biotin carboxylase
MKVKNGPHTYLVHWVHDVTDSKRDYHNQPVKKLNVTHCIVREVDPNDNAILINKEAVVQNYHDTSNLVVARKASLAKAIQAFDKSTRTNFWNAYKQSARIIPGKSIKSVEAMKACGNYRMQFCGRALRES